MANEPARWDLDYEVVVAGYGYAGAISTITASDAGARCLILEKMSHFPGLRCRRARVDIRALVLDVGNNSECFIGGRIAGTNAAEEMPWC